MAYNALNNLIDAYIYANGVQAITGQILNGVIKQMVSQLGSGYHLMGVAGPETVPASNDYAMAYFAATAGEYTDFGGIILAAGEVAVLLTYGNGSWSKQTIYNVPTGTADLENTADFITNAVTDLVNYYTKTEVDDTLANYPTLEALATALADYYTKTEIDGQKAETDAALGDRYTKDETDTKLEDYYKKVETYDKDEVDSIVAALSRQEYIVAWDGLAAPDVSAIPAGVAVTYSGTTYTGTLAASASTMNKIQMVWNGTAYDMYGTSQDGGYSWVPMGTTSVDLSQYATKAELSQLEAEVDDITHDPGTPIDVNSIAGGYKLTGDGLCTTDASTRMKKYLVTAGDTIYLKLSADNPGVYQFQSAASVPSSGTNANLVGSPVTTATDGFVKVPSGATHLIVSQNDSNTTNEVRMVITYSLSNFKEKITDLDQELNGTVIPFIPEWQETDKYIKPNGDVAAAVNWRISRPFVLKAGRTLTVKSQGNNACIIAGTVDGTTYTPLVSAPYTATGLNTYTYKTDVDKTIALSVKWGLGDVVMQTSMPNIAGEVKDIYSAFKTIGTETTITETQSVASGGRLNKTLDLSQYDGQIVRFSVKKTGGTSSRYLIMIGSVSVVGSQFGYGASETFILDSNIDKPTFYGPDTEGSAADFEIKVELFPNYGLEDADKKIFLEDKEYAITPGYHINTNNSVLPNTPTENADAGYATGEIREGDILAVKGSGPTQYVGLYAFYDRNKNKILFSGNAYLQNRAELQVIAPAGSAYFAYNSSVYNALTDSVKVRSALVLRSSIKELQEKMDLVYPYMWNGKTIVCFGDSITEFGDQYGKRYSDYMADFTGATVINVAIGGTRLACRTTPVETPTNSMQGYAALDMANLVDAVVTQDFDIVDAGAEWVRDNASDDNTPIIARLKAIDWTKVDAVTIMGGSNDWSGEAAFGTSGEVSKFTTLGAINFIIQNLLGAYPKLKIYWFTPIVRWLNYSGGVGLDTDWCDVLKKNGRTLEEVSEAIEADVRKSHLPVCDTYHTLGWNKYNFSQYFPANDGSHAIFGFPEMGKKFASFIFANRTF